MQIFAVFLIICSAIKFVSGIRCEHIIQRAVLSLLMNGNIRAVPYLLPNEARICQKFKLTQSLEKTSYFDD